MITIPRAVLAPAFLLLNAAAALGHTLAGTMISVAATSTGTVTITIEAEADPLIAKLETLVGTEALDAPDPQDPLTTSAERRARIESLFPTLRANIDARIERQPIVLELQDVAVDDTAQTAIRLIGKLPPGHPAVTWRSTFIVGAYRVTIRRGGTGEVIEWLQGSQTSTPITLEPPAAEADASALRLASNRIGFSLGMAALVVYVLCRRRTVHRLAGG
jgi:hypothetical protein